MIRWLVVVLALVACKKKAAEVGEACGGATYCQSRLHCVAQVCTTGDIGDACTRRDECTDCNDCVDGHCRGPGKLGETCWLKNSNATTRCDGELACLDRVCVGPAAIAKHEETKQEEARKQAALKERTILDQAGVSTTPVAETTTPPPGAGTRVRTVTITSETTAFAPCKADERLIGGGCKTQDLDSSYPSGQSAEDTVGARWNCVTDRGAEVTAFALCSKLP